MASAEPASTDKTEPDTPPTELSAFQRDVLAVAARLDSEYADGPHGLAIKAGLESAGYGNVNHGRLYPNLDELVQRGLLEKGAKDDRTNYYRVTERGRGVLEGLVSWVSGDV